MNTYSFLRYRAPIYAVVLAAISTLVAAEANSDELDFVVISEDGTGFVFASTNKPFVPWGFNYDHDLEGRLLEDYWNDNWAEIETAFANMKELGANVVRIHLQVGAFMESPSMVKEASLARLADVVELAAANNLYLDLTGLGCYHKQDVPEWYDDLTEEQRWQTQAVFWEAVAATCADSPAIFCYDLMNEPVVPGGAAKRDDWLGPGFGDKFFVQFVALETKGRPRSVIAKAWIDQLVEAIRKHDRRHLITVGMVPWSLDRKGLTSGFDPHRVSENLDFIAMHIYPESGKHDEAIETLEGFAAVGKPVVIEEIFPLKCNVKELEAFIDASHGTANGWIGFYWGKMPDDYRPAKTIADALTLGWLELFARKASEMKRVPSDQ